MSGINWNVPEDDVMGAQMVGHFARGQYFSKQRTPCLKTGALSEYTSCGVQKRLQKRMKANRNLLVVISGTTSRWTVRVARQVNNKIYTLITLPKVSVTENAPV